MDNSLSQKTIQKYIEYLLKRSIPSYIIQRKLNALKRFFSWAREQNKIDEKKFSELISVLQKELDRISTQQPHRLVPGLDKVFYQTKRWLNGILMKKSEQKIGTTETKESPKRAQFSFPSNLGVQHYIGIALVLVLMATLGAGAFNQFFNKAQTPFAFPSQLTKPAQRYVSFQGRVTDSLGNPITTATNFQFKFYNAKTGGSSLYATGTCSLTPDQDGILNVLVGGSGLTTDQNVCGTGIPENIFSDFPNVYLGITIGADSEATPRQQIANVGYAVNAETLQGFPPGTGKSTIPYLDLNGDVLIATSGASIKSLYESANFTLASSKDLILQSAGPAAGAGDIILQASGSGALRFRTAGANSDTFTRIFVANGGNVGVGNTTASQLLTVGSSEQVIANSTGNVTITPSTNSTALTLTGTSATSAVNLNVDTRNTSTSSTTGVVNLAYGGATTQAGSITGVNLDLSTNLTSNLSTGGNSLVGQNITLPLTTTNTNTSGTDTYKGINISSGGSTTQNGAGGTLNWIGLDITMPAQTQTAGTLTNWGLRVTGGTNTSGTQNLIELISVATTRFIINNTGNMTQTAGTTTGTTTTQNSNSLTSGKALLISSTATAYSGTSGSSGFVQITKSGASGSTAFVGDIFNTAYSQTFNGGVGLNSTGNVLNISRSITLNNAGNTHTISGAVATISDTGTQTAGTLTNTANVLSLNQSYANATGNVLTIANSGTGKDISGTSNTWNVTKAGLATFTTGTIIATQTFTTNNITDSGALTITSTGANALTLEGGSTGLVTIAGTSTGGVNIAGSGTGDVNIAGGSGSTGCTVTNSNGNLACAGTITSGGTAAVIGSGTQNRLAKFTITGSTIGDSSITDTGSAVTLASNVTFATAGTGTITSASTLTASNGLTLTTGALSLTGTSGSIALTGFGTSSITSTTTTGDILALADSSFAVAGGATGNLANLTFTNASTNTSGTSTVTGLNIAGTLTASGSLGTHETYGIRIQDLAGSTAGLGTQSNYGIRVGNQGKANTESSYGLYVDSQTGSSNSYAAVFAGGNVGIGSTGPSSLLSLFLPQPASVGTTPGTAAIGELSITGGTGGNTSIATTGVGGTGADLLLSAGQGGTAPLANTASTGGKGGAIEVDGGNGGAAAAIGTNLGGAGGALTLTGGTGGAASGGSSNTGGAGGAVTILSGSAGTGGNANGGTLRLDTGTKTGTGTSTLQIGNTNATALALGNSSSTFALTSTGGLNVTTGGALTGVASLDTITTSGTALTFTSTAPTISVSTTATGISLEAGTTGVVTIAGTSTGGVNIAGSGTGDVNIAGGSGSTGCTVTNSTGDLACSAGISGGAGSFTTLTSSGNTTLATGASTTNTFGSGASSINTIGSTTTPGALTLHGATTLDNTFTVSGASTNLIKNITGTSALTVTVNPAGGPGFSYASNTWGMLSRVSDNANSISKYGIISYVSSTGTGDKINFYADNDNTGSLYSLYSPSSSAILYNAGSVGINNVSPVGKLDVSGAVTGKALAIFNETGDQSPLVASESAKPVFVVAHPTGTIVNGFTLTPSISGSGVGLASTGDDTNIALSINAKGTGALNLATANTGNVAIGNATGTFALTSSSATLTLGSSITAFNVNSGVFDIDTTNSKVGIGTAAPASTLDIQSTRTSGTLLSVAASSTLTQTGQIIGQTIDLTNYTPASGSNLVGSNATFPTSISIGAADATTYIFRGYGVNPTGTQAITEAGAGTVNFYGYLVNMPNITQTAGTLNAQGVRIVTGDITTGGTEHGISIVASGGTRGAGTLNAINISNITAQAATETAIAIGNNWDNVLTVGGTSIINGSGNINSATIGQTTAAAGKFTTLTSTGATDLANAGASNVTIATTGTGTVAIGNATGTFALTSSSATLILGSSITAFNVNSGVFDINTTNSRVGIGTAAPSATLDVQSTRTGGTLFSVGATSAVTQTGAIIGQFIDLTNYTPTGGLNLTGSNLQFPSISIGAADATTYTFQGYGMTSTPTMTEAGAGTVNFYGVKIQLPNITQTAGTINANGLRVEAADITTGGTEYGVNIVASAGTRGAGTLNAINISNITAQAATETAIAIGNNWDNVLTVGGTAIINGSGVTQIVGGGTAATTSQGAINNLSQLTTTGDLLYHNGTNSNRLARGTNGQCLTANTTTIVWGSCSGASTVALSSITAATTTNGIVNNNFAQVWNWNTLTTEIGMTFGGGSAMTTGSVFALGGATYVHTALNDIGNLASITFTDASTNANNGGVTSGLNIASTLNTTGAGTKTISAADIAAPTITGCTTGACTWNGLRVTTLTSGAVSTLTSNGLNITATGVGAGTLTGVNISGITGAAGTETALAIGSGWDNAISINSGALTLNSNTIDSSGALSLGTTNATSISLGNNTGATALNLTSGTGAQTFTSSVATGNAFSFTGSSVSSGNLLLIVPGTGLINGGNIINVTSPTVTLASGTVNMLNFPFTDASAAGTSSFVNGVRVAPSINSSGAGATKRTVGFLVDPGATQTCSAGTCTLAAFRLASSSITQAASATFNIYGADFVMPNITQTTGIITTNGVNLTTGSITTAGTENAVNIAATGVGAGTLTGVNISGITGAAGTETALAIGSGWDNAISINSGALTLNSNTIDSSGALSLGTTNATSISLGNNTGATALNLTSGTGAQTHTSSVVSGTGATSAFVFNASALTSGTALRLTSTSTSGILFDQNATNTSGTINNLAYGAAKTQAGNITGVNLDFNTNLAGQVGAAADFTGLQLKTLPAVTETGNFAHNYIGYNLPSPGAITNQGTSTFAFNGFNLSSPGALTQNTAAGTINWSGANITLPASTSTFNAGNINPVGVKITAGNITASGGGNATESAVLVDQSSATITTGGTINGFLMNAAGVGAGTLNGIKISNITGGAGTENAINIGTGWDNDIVFNNASPTIKFAATDNTTNLSIVDTSSNNLLAMRDLSTNFGAAVTSGAFISRNSYYGDEFVDFHVNNCSQTTTNNSAHARGDYGSPNGAACAAANGELGTNNVLGVAASGNTCTESSQNLLNGVERITATSTTTASNTAACLEYLSQSGTTANNIFAANNLPVVVAKVRPSVTSSSNSNARFFIGIGDKTGVAATANGQMPNNGIFFSNCSTFGATPTCTNTTWQGVVTSGGAIVGTVQSCTTGTETGTINTTNFNYLRIEVRSNTDIHFFVDTDTTTGISETECGTGVTSTGPGATALAVMMESDVMSNVAVTEDLDIDYFRVWQDDNAPATGTTSLPPVEAEQIPDFTEQSSIAQDYLINNFTPIPGTLVSFDTQSSVPTVKLADREYDPHLAGIVTSNSGIDLSNNTIKGAIKVATHGRTTVRVSDENGPIRVGDYLTSSASHPGFAMRATRPGPVIGTALSSYSGGDLNQVIIEVNRTYQDPDTQLTSSGDLKIALNQQGQKNDESQKFNLLTSTNEVVKRVGAYSEIASAYLKVGLVKAEELIVQTVKTTNLITQNITANTVNITDLVVSRITTNEKITSPIIETKDINATGTAYLNQISTNGIKPQEQDVTVDLTQKSTSESGPLARILVKGLDGKIVSTIDAAGNASFSGTLAAKEASISGTIAAGKVQTNEASISGKLTAKEIESDTISQLRDRLTLAAADSGQAKTTSQELSTSVNNIQSLLAEIRKQPLSDPQYYQNLDNNPVVSSLTVSGDTTLYNATIANSLTAGTISIENNQLISLTTELKLSALSSVNILDGAVVITRDGTMTTKGTIIAKGGIEVQNSDLRFKNSQGVETAQIDSSGSAKFKSLSLDKYLDATSSAIIATPEENFNKNGLFASAIETQKQTAGLGIIPIDSSEIVIYNQTVRDASLIYLTPTTQNSSQLTVSQKQTCGPQSSSNCKPYFKVTSNQPVHPEIGFNWLIIN